MNGEPRKIRYAVSAQTARDVFLACCERARREHGSQVFRATVREVAELANVESSTAFRALKCLVAAGYLHPCGHTPVQAGLYTFGRKILSDVVKTFDVEDHVTLCKNHDAFSRGALGKASQPIWNLLLQEQLRAVEISRRLKINESTVHRSLKKLARFGLVQKVGRLWQGNAVSEEILENVAKKCGTAGRSERREDKHKTDRSRYVTALILQRKRAWERKNHIQTAKFNSKDHANANQR